MYKKLIMIFCLCSGLAFSGEIKMNIVAAGNNLEMKAGNQVIKTKAAWKALAKELRLEKIPKIDFEKHMLVAVFMGRKNSGGYAIKVEKVEEKAGKIVVTVKRQTPPPGGMVTMALTGPYQIVKMPVSDKEVIFK